MKKLFTVFLCAIVVVATYAQMPRWVISPNNNSLSAKLDNKLLESSFQGQNLIWSMDGKLLYSTADDILPFKNGAAPVLKKGTEVITGYIDDTGKFTPLPDVMVAYGNPYFEDNLLLCYDKDHLAYFGKDGMKVETPEVVKTYPFHHGYAPYFSYGQLEKKKDPHYGYFRSDGRTTKYFIEDNGKSKLVSPNDLSFLSGISSDGKAVGVIKNKLYWFDPETETFEPMLRGDEESLKKRHLNLQYDHESYFQNLPDDTICIRAKYGKDNVAELKFDRELRPVTFIFNDGEIKYQEPEQRRYEYSTTLSEFGDSGNYGIRMNSKEVLPRQFENVGLKYGNMAFVKKDGKWGVIEIVPDLTYSLKLNKGEDVAFRHQKYETQIRLDLPVEISAKEARIDIPDDTGCVIDKTSRESKDTESGNFVTYDCVLTIPASLPDTIMTITYQPVRVSYDGLSLFEIPLDVKAWHLKYYNVDPIESETSISNGMASFTLNVNAQRNVGESDYPFEVMVEADDSLSVEYEKMSETRYKCIVSNLQDGDNNMNIYITEKGCPSSVFPFVINYTKPVPKERKKEEVAIRKKEPAKKPKDQSKVKVLTPL